jgi:phosphoadenosine phosphosulfate reductase
MTRAALSIVDDDFDADFHERRLRHASPLCILEFMFEVFGRRIAAVSSFGAESAVLLSMIAEIDPGATVLFVDTGHLFPETIAYRDLLVARLGLTGVRTIGPGEAEIGRRDPGKSLWAENADACCALRKVEPLAGALAPFDAWINGRKSYHGFERARLPLFERDGRRIKVNPLACMTREDIEAAFTARGLPRHPLEPHGYASIGCMPCTSRVLPGESVRAGRWRGSPKHECGIHTIIAGPRGL